MPEFPHISGNEAVKIFVKLGFKIARQKGSHVVLRRENKGCVIPLHKEVAIGTLLGALKQAGITVDQFIEAYKN